MPINWIILQAKLSRLILIKMKELEILPGLKRIIKKAQITLKILIN